MDGVWMWIFLPKFHSFQATEDCPWDSASVDYPQEPSVTLNKNPMPNELFKPASQMDYWMKLLSGMTLKHSTGDPGLDKWILYQRAFPVSHTVLPGNGKANKILRAETSGPIPSVLLGKWDVNGRFWRMSQVSLWEMDNGHHMGAPWLENWPKQGMTVNGELYPLPTQEHLISETDGGSWRTPTAADWKNMGSSTQVYLSDQVRPSQVTTSKKPGQWPTPTSTERSGTNPNTGRGEGLWKRAQMFPTPRAGKTTDEDEEAWLARHNEGKVATPPLALAARLWATPRVNDSKNNASTSQRNRRGPDLNVQVTQWSTPTTMDSLPPKSQKALDRESETARPGRTNPANLRDQIAVSEDQTAWPTPTTLDATGRGTRTFDKGNWATSSLGLAVEEGSKQGALSPNWVAWIMGLPVGWTSMEPLAREDYAEWFDRQLKGIWWLEEQGLPRVTTGIQDRVAQLKALGNGVVPASLARFLSI